MLHQFESEFSKLTAGKGGRTMVAASGGRDSMVLCELMHRAGKEFAIAHCNFGLRADESDGDEDFVEAAAERYKVPFHVAHFETERFSRSVGLSIQEAARKLRYDWFARIAEEFSYNFIATAHHLDDSIETFFINLIRGTGIAGLHGIPSTNGNIIRPLNSFSSGMIAGYADENKIMFREDSSNAGSKYLRNRIRHELIPVLKNIAPQFEATMRDNMKRFDEASSIIDSVIESNIAEVCKESGKSISIDLGKLQKQEGAAATLVKILSEFGFSAAHAYAIYNSVNRSGATHYSRSHRLAANRGKILVSPLEGLQATEIAIPEDLQSLSVQEFRLNLSRLNRSELSEIPVDRNKACIDADLLKFPLQLRRWKKGDYFFPLGMKGRKKLSDYFTDRKFSLQDKEGTWLLVSGDEIVWIVGERLDNRFRITSKTKNIYFADAVFPLTL